MNTVLYHAQCDDGYVAACCAAAALEGEATQYWPCTYGKPLPEEAIIDGAAVYVLDFSFPLEVMEDMEDRAASFTWLDHHETSRPTALALCRALSDVPFTEDGTGDVSLTLLKWAAGKDIHIVHCQVMSGAGLAWHGLVDPERTNPVVEYVQQRDLWQHKAPGALPEADEFTAGLRLLWQHRYHAPTPTLLGVDPREFIALGRQVLVGVERRIGQTLAHCRLAGVLDQPCVVVNNTDFEIVSDLGLRMLDANPDSTVSIQCSLRDTGWTWNLRSRNGEARMLAEQFGGGGHPNAAGASGLEFPAWSVPTLWEPRR